MNKDKIPALIVRRLFSPRHAVETLRRVFWKKKRNTAWNNSQLALYSGILKSDFLHYGRFEPGTTPESLSIEEITRAQKRYSEKLLELIGPEHQPVLDVGAGMGGISRMLLERGITPVPLTPDRAQIDYISRTYPAVELIPERFQNVDWSGSRDRFGCVLTAESCQYFSLDQAFTTVPSILRPGGRWVVCDYFRRNGSSLEASGHLWSDFRARAEAPGWSVVHEEEITEEVLPGLAYIAMLGERFVHPIYEFLQARLQRNHPALHYLLEDVFALQDERYERGRAIVDPDLFRSEKQYMLVALEKK